MSRKTPSASAEKQYRDDLSRFCSENSENQIVMRFCITCLPMPSNPTPAGSPLLNEKRTEKSCGCLMEARKAWPPASSSVRLCPGGVDFILTRRFGSEPRL